MRPNCVDLKNDINNCGSCGRKVPWDGGCRNGVPGCDDGWSQCGGRCVDLQNDLNNCGSRGNKVNYNEASCTKGQIDCFGNHRT